MEEETITKSWLIDNESNGFKKHYPLCLLYLLISRSITFYYYYSYSEYNTNSIAN